MDAIFRLAEHVVATQFDDLPEHAIAATKTFLLDSFGVAVVGSSVTWTPKLIAAQSEAAEGGARVWVRGTRLSAPAAALCNGYQLHNSEFDCVHEAAVVHPMAVLLPAAMAHAERSGGVSGRDFLAAITLGVDVGAGLGVGSKAPLKFFRPATAGAFAATAAIGRMKGFDVETLVNAFAITHSQLCGTMQAHSEGSPLLPVQVGFNARNAMTACDMAATGMPGPHNVLEGPYGFYPLFEGAHDLAPVLERLGTTWRITEVAHKPFPTGRATHGVIDGVLQLMREHNFSSDDVTAVVCRVPSLTHRLVGRPAHDAMAVSYARLSAPYAIACALLNDGVEIGDFSSESLVDPERLAVAARVRVEIDDNPDANAMAPVEVTVELADGATHEIRVEEIYGNPARPMSNEAHLAKFRRNWVSGAVSLDPAAGEVLIAKVAELEALNDVAELVDLLIAA
ncbi:MAG: MmgE/PrpD family protein [Pseudomonadota bacterium]